MESYSDTIKRKVNINKLSTIIEQRSLKSILLLISKKQLGLKVCEKEYHKFCRDLVNKSKNKPIFYIKIDK